MVLPARRVRDTKRTGTRRTGNLTTFKVYVLLYQCIRRYSLMLCASSAISASAVAEAAAVLLLLLRSSVAATTATGPARCFFLLPNSYV